MSKKISRIHREIKKVKSQGFPCFSALDLDGEIINVMWNKKEKITKNHLRYENHAEFLLLEKIRNAKAKKIVVYQTFLPCSDCLKAIESLNKKITFIYLFDPWMKKRNKGWKNGVVTFHQLQPTKHNQVFIDYNWNLIKTRYEKPSHKNSYEKLSELHGNFENIRYN